MKPRERVKKPRGTVIPDSLQDAHRSTRSRPPFSITSFASIFVRRIGYALRKSGRASRLMVSCLLLSMPLPFYSSAHGNEAERGAPAPVALSQDAAGNHVVHMSLAVTVAVWAARCSVR